MSFRLSASSSLYTDWMPQLYEPHKAAWKPPHNDVLSSGRLTPSWERRMHTQEAACQMESFPELFSLSQLGKKLIENYENQKKKKKTLGSCSGKTVLMCYSMYIIFTASGGSLLREGDFCTTPQLPTMHLTTALNGPLSKKPLSSRKKKASLWIHRQHFIAKKRPCSLLFSTFLFRSLERCSRSALSSHLRGLWNSGQVEGKAAASWQDLMRKISGVNSRRWLNWFSSSLFRVWGAFSLAVATIIIMIMIKEASPDSVWWRCCGVAMHWSELSLWSGRVCIVMQYKRRKKRLRRNGSKL